MNALSRPLFSAPPEMVEGSGITSMAMGEEQGMPMGGEQAALDIGGMIAGQLAAGIDQTERNIDAVAEDDTGGLMNALRDKNASVEDYRDELADIVGPKDAAATPESVLALVQPTLAMMEMEQGIGAMGGAMGDMGAMGGMGEDMALMGGMGGGIGDMMPQGLPQGLPMPMGDDMVAVQEEVVGRMPPVEGMQRGGVVSIPAGKKSLPFDPNDPSVQHFVLGGTPTFDESVQERIAARQKYFGEAPLLEGRDKLTTILGMAAPFVESLLTPKEQGGGIGGATAALSRAAVAELKDQEARKRANDQRQFTQQQTIAQGAFASEEAARTAANLAADNLAKTLASRTTPKITSTQSERTLERLYAQGTITAERRDELLLDIAEKAAQSRQTDQEIATAGTVAAEVEKADIREFQDYGKEIRKGTQESVSIAQKGRNYLEAMEGLETGPFTGTVTAFSNKIRQLSSMAGIDADKFIEMAGLGEAFNVSKAQAAQVALGAELGRQFTLLFASNVKGNLNQSEFNEVQSMGTDVRNTPEGNARIVELYERAEKRALERQQIFRDISRAAPRGQSSKETMFQIQEKIAEFEEAYKGDKGIEKSNNDPNRIFPNYDFASLPPVNVGAALGTKKMQKIFSDSKEAVHDRSILIEAFGSGDKEMTDSAFRSLIGGRHTRPGSLQEKEQFAYFAPVIAAAMRQMGMSEEQARNVLERYSQ